MLLFLDDRTYLCIELIYFVAEQYLIMFETFLCVPKLEFGLKTGICRKCLLGTFGRSLFSVRIRVRKMIDMSSDDSKTAK